MNEIFNRLDGQPRARAVLKSSASHGGGSYLFVGPPGAGKADASRVFAAACLCPQRCGACKTCSRVLRDVHSDVSVYQSEGLTYPVDLIREMVAAASLTPLEATRRVMIVEDAGRIAERAQNALLKALEEPNQSVTWILVSDAVEGFLPTVLSRCHIVEFVPVAEEDAVPLVKSRLSLSSEEALVAVRASRGDLDRAIALAGDASARELRRVAIDAAASRRPESAWALETADWLKRASGSARAQSESAQKEELERMEDVLSSPSRRRLGEKHRRALRKVETDVFVDFLMWLGSAFRDLAAVSAGASPEEVTNTDRAGDISEAASSRSTAEWLDLAEATLDAQLAIAENANTALTLEALLLRLASPPAFA